LCRIFSAASQGDLTATTNLETIHFGINRKRHCDGCRWFCFLVLVLVLDFAFAFGVGFGFVPFRCELPKKRAAKRKKKRNLSELRATRGRVISLPALPLAFSGTPKGQFAAVAFLCLLSLAKQRK
jgi:hypothetical protein